MPRVSKTKFPKLRARYDEEYKAIVFDDMRYNHIPNHTYYMCEKLSVENNLDIVNVIYAGDTSRAYRLEELRGVFDWNDIDEREEK